MSAFIAGLALGAVWGLLGWWRQWRREQRVALEAHRNRARELRADGEDVFPAWMIGSPSDPLFRDPVRESAYREWQVRRRLGEFSV